MDRLAPLVLKKGEERRIRSGHPWVYSNEVDTARTPLTELKPGDPVEILSSTGKFLGNGYLNPATLITARIVSRDPRYRLDRSLLIHRFKVALSLRERLFNRPFYRLVHGEADGMPGVVVDRYGEIVVVQITTAGMERVQSELLEALQKVVRPEAILLRNDTPARRLEGLDLRVETAYGTVPEQVRLEENGVPFLVSLLQGQKTGWYYDHRLNRRRMQYYAAGARVLDLCSYVGGWGVQAAVAGAAEVHAVDSSEQALGLMVENGRLNGVEDRLVTHQGDLFERLKQFRQDRQQFDLIVLDPPAFIKRKRDHKRGLEAYRRANELAMRLLSRDGILFSASCSHHLQREQLLRLLQGAGRHIDRTLMLLEEGHQGPDHPVHPAIPETAYIKCMTLRLLPGGNG